MYILFITTQGIDKLLHVFYINKCLSAKVEGRYIYERPIKTTKALHDLFNYKAFEWLVRQKKTRKPEQFPSLFYTYITRPIE